MMVQFYILFINENKNLLPLYHGGKQDLSFKIRKKDKNGPSSRGLTFHFIIESCDILLL